MHQLIADCRLRITHHRHSLTRSGRRAIIARPLGKNKGEVTMTIRVVCYGLGPIGIGIARLALARAGVEVVGAIDLDPQKIGRDLGALTGAADAGVIISGDAAATLAETRPNVVLHATSSALAKVSEQLAQIAKAGAHVVSTCEE